MRSPKIASELLSHNDAPTPRRWGNASSCAWRWASTSDRSSPARVGESDHGKVPAGAIHSLRNSSTAAATSKAPS